MEELKCKLKSVYASYFAKQASSIQEIAEIIRKFELNQALAKETKLLRLILTVPAISVSCKRSSSSLKNFVNNLHMNCFQIEERLNNKDFLKKIKGADTFL